MEIKKAECSSWALMCCLAFSIQEENETFMRVAKETESRIKTKNKVSTTSEQQTQTKSNKNKNHPRYYLDIPELRHYDSTLLVKHLQNN